MALLQTLFPSFHDQIVWYNVFILSVWHLGFFYAIASVLPYATYTEWLVLWIGLWVVSGLGITAGAHRLWAHRSYKAHTSVRLFLMLANAMAFQGSIFEWARDHRVHHKGSETDADPHNAQRGFFFSHMGWVMVRKHPKVISEGKKLNVNDLLTEKIVMFQRRHYLPLVLVLCYALPTMIGYSLGSAWNGFWIGGIFRHVWVLHMTWCVNSVAHMFGDRPYAPHINPAENLLVSIGAIGEGWHNYHHKYPTDYATGEFGITTGQWNPTKVFIDVCAALGLASELKRSRTAKATRERIALEKLKAQKLNPQVPTGWFDRLVNQFFFGRSEEEMF